MKHILTPGERIEAFMVRNPHMREVTETQMWGKETETLEVLAELIERLEKLSKEKLQWLYDALYGEA
ncbi:MAG: hypothetical protein ABIE47_13130 [Pseudomonadota bacterium]